MLILIAGITGNIGQHAARHALTLGHQVRGLSRTPDKLDASIMARCEDFVCSTTYYDIAALEQACAGVDAVICAYAGIPELHLEGQLLLLRAAERAGVTRFLAASHNNDWRKVAMGEVPVYDPARMFHVQAALTSTIKALHIFSGTFVDVLFGGQGQGNFTPEVGGVWDSRTDPPQLHVWGSGLEKWCLTTEEDGGKWAVDLVTSDNAGNGGFVSLCSMELSLMELKDTYERLRGKEVQIIRRGTIDDLEKTVEEKKDAGSHWADWLRYAFVLHCTKGTWALSRDTFESFHPSEPTSLEAWLEKHPNV
ncbi:NAD(P)-binding protein, partial [Aureobasidium melanogenum]